MPAIFTSRNTRSGRCFWYSRDRVDGIADGTHLVPLELEQLAERRANPLLVVDDQDAPRNAHRTVLYKVILLFATRMSPM